MKKETTSTLEATLAYMLKQISLPCLQLSSRTKWSNKNKRRQSRRNKNETRKRRQRSWL